ncbi:hypothetical protein C0V72_07920 [Porphyrobacter sp. TH134]|uniref:hypothetical protein n=1 Tax=Porphyrobacter sp. TH134 TaxID=2067450 RepID=UPI000C79D6EF|nr:hypothetical protein [Porphyrobacter sp. TH134]PLK23810.1 hypothetical protein C0V72_07920 [Porphyrobacter sp. TH134]
MRVFLGLLAIGVAAYAVTRRGAGPGHQGRAAFADDQPDLAANPVRDAGPQAMRDPQSEPWSAVDEASDQSFPASDPPSTY